ncbi:MAG: hypothetical protein IMZ58_08460 [Thermoplasmata archaeon]|nr:hypothetical protein [Thermoplasmata archaeon]
MFKSILVLLALAGLLVAGSRDGVVIPNNTNSAQNLNESTRSSADWKDSEELNVSGTQEDTLWMDTLYSTTTYYARVKCFLNNSGSVAVVKVINAWSGNYVNYKMPAYGTTGKIPYVRAVIVSGTSDSLIPLWQAEYK